jgi:hypothetical protein
MNAKPRSAYLLSFAAAAVLAGCSSEVTYDDPRLEQIDAELVRAESCEDLEAKVRADAIARVDRQLDAYILMADQFERNDRGDPFGGDEFLEGGDGEDAAMDGGAESEGSSGAGGATNGGPASGGGGGQQVPDHSETNNQVEGIDEADIVKTDGLNLYVLHGAEFSILKAWPAADLGVSQSLALEGTPIEMFVEGGKAVIFARADGTNIYSAAGVSPKKPFTLDWYYGGGYYGEGAGDYGEGCYDGYGGYDCGPQNPLTQVVVLDISSGSPTVEREFFFEGDYLSSRREGNQVRVVLSGGAHLPNVNVMPQCSGGCEDGEDWRDAVESARSLAHGVLASAKLEDFTPYRFQRTAGAVSTLEPGCEGYWVPTAGSSEYGLTQVETIDLGNLAAGPQETAIVGAVQTVYANGSTMVLAGQSFDTSRFAGGVVSAEEFMVNTTYLHRFDLDTDPKGATYTGSATIPGMLIEQFAIDEKDGVLRVATHVQLSNGNEWRQNNALYTLSGAPGALGIQGRIEGIAPNEDMYAVRFVGNKGYFVTFEQIDPLFVFDLSNPSDPKLKGELHIPGFSEYMHPIDDGHLLTIGVDDGGWGVALQIFDVTDDLNPKLAHKLSLGDGTSEALYQHKAFTFWRDMLAVPVQGWDGDSYQAGLSLFTVDVATGFGERGTIDHSEFFNIDESYSYCSPGGVRRGVFIEDYIYSVSDGGVLVHDVSDLSVPVAGAEFTSYDASEVCDGYYY